MAGKRTNGATATKRNPIRELKPKAAPVIEEPLDDDELLDDIEEDSEDSSDVSEEEGTVDSTDDIDELTTGLTEPKKRGPKGKKGRKGRKGRPKGKGKDSGTALDKVLADEPLTPAEYDRFVELDTTVGSGIEGFVQTGLALSEIQANRLYRQEYKTFAEYLNRRHGISQRFAYYAIGGSRVMKELETAGVENLPTSRVQSRHLTSVPEDKIVSTWEDANKLAEAEGIEQPEERHVKAAADKVLGRTPALPREPRDVQSGRKNGAIPAQAKVRVREQESEGEETVDIDLPDAEWLAQFDDGIRSKLAPKCKDIFDRDALDYRWIASHRIDFIGHIKRLVGSTLEVGPYIGGLLYRLRRPDPSGWQLCPTCQGQGTVETLGKKGPCTDCKRSAGYKV